MLLGAEISIFYLSIFIFCTKLSPDLLSWVQILGAKINSMKSGIGDQDHLFVLSWICTAANRSAVLMVVMYIPDGIRNTGRFGSLTRNNRIAMLQQGARHLTMFLLFLMRVCGIWSKIIIYISCETIFLRWRSPTAFFFFSPSYFIQIHDGHFVLRAMRS